MPWWSRILAALALAGMPSCLCAQTFGARTPETDYFSAHEFKLLAEHAINQEPEKLAGARLYTRAEGDRIWQEAEASFEKQALQWNVKVLSDGGYEFYEQFPLLGMAAPGVAVKAHRTVTVDSVPPVVEITEPSLGSIVQAGEKPLLRYSASDAHLDNKRAIDVYASGPEGFLKLATAVLNSGSMRLELDSDFGNRYTVFVVASDRAGNVSADSVTFTFGEVVDPLQEPSLPSADRPRLSVSFPSGGRIWHRKTDFAYVVENFTESKLAAVEVMFSIDDGLTWQFGGKNDSGQASGFVTFELPYSLRRHQGQGAYDQIRFAFLAVTENGALSRELPMEGDSGDLTVAVDVVPPVVFLESPHLDEVYRKDASLDAEGDLVVAWNAHDRNLEPLVAGRRVTRGPVSIYYTTQPQSGDFDQSWRLIAKDLPEVDTFATKLDLPDAEEMVIIVAATDEMGNVSTVRSGVFAITSDRVVQPDLRENLAGKEADRHWANAVAAQQQGELSLALEEYDKALSYAPARAAIHHDKGSALYALGRVEEAKAAFEKAVELEKDEPGFRYSLAVLLFKEDDHEAAQRQLDVILAGDAKSPHVGARMLLATIHQKAGRIEDAVPLWESVVKNAAKGSAEYRAAKRNLDWAASREK